MASSFYTLFGSEPCCTDFIGNKEFLKHISEKHVGNCFEIFKNQDIFMSGDFFGVYKICDDYDPGCVCPNCARYHCSELKLELKNTKQEVESLKHMLTGE
jgi:hypothetical protein